MLKAEREKVVEDRRKDTDRQKYDEARDQDSG